MDDLMIDIQAEVSRLDAQLRFALRLLRYQGNVGDVIDALPKRLRNRVRRCTGPDRFELFKRIQREIEI